LAAGLAALGAQAQQPVPRPATGAVLQTAEKALAPGRPAAPAITSFTLGGFQVLRVEPSPGAQPAAFSGRGWLVLPPPLEGLAVTFQNLVLAGTVATGTLGADFPAGLAPSHQDWTWAPKSVRIADQGSHLVGALGAGRLQVQVDSVLYTPAGLSGTLDLGDLPLGEGPFTATLKDARITFSTAPPLLQGNLDVTLGPAFRNADTGQPVEAVVPASFNAPALSAGNLADPLATGLGVESQGLVFRFPSLALAMADGTPVLRGSARLSFPLQTFCQAADTGQPFQSQPAAASLRGAAPPGTVLLPAQAPARSLPLQVQRPGTPVPAGGFGGSFPLPGASLLPTGLLSYHLNLTGGMAVVTDGAIDPAVTKVSGSLLWGPGWSGQVDFQNVPADLGQGLFLTQGALKGEVPVGAYGIQSSQAGAVLAFSATRTPPGFPAGWKGVYLPAYLLALPEDLFSFDAAGNRLTTFVQGQGGVFEADGGFSGKVAVTLGNPVYLEVMPVKLDPFQLEFADGALLGMPQVTGTTDLDQPPLLPKFYLPVAFDLTQNGPQKILLTTHTAAGDTTLKTDLVGIDMVLSGATLNPTDLDLSGRFDFHLKGAALPSIPFDHMVLEATGGGLDGQSGAIRFDLEGSLWNNVAAQPQISLWGFNFDLVEDGYGRMADGRVYVGVGGEIGINPMLSVLYNRFLFTSDKNDPAQGTVETVNGFNLDQSIADLGSLQASLGFGVDTASDQVSDAYFLGSGALSLAFGDSPVNLQAGMLFGQGNLNTQPFPYFYLLGEATFPTGGIEIAPDVEIYGFSGGLTQNFMPDQLQNLQNVTGRKDASLGTGIVAGVDLGTSDEFTFHGNVNLYVSQDLSAAIFGQGFLFSGREDSPADRTVNADISLTQKPTAFHAVLQADLGYPSSLVECLGTVELKFDPDNHFVHIGTRGAPIATRFLSGLTTGTSYMDADFSGGKATFSAGTGFSLDTGDQDFGVVYGRLYADVNGSFVIVIDPSFNPAFQGVLDLEGGAEFGMSFPTFWQTYNLTIFNGNLSANLALQVPGSPTLDGHVDINYSVLGGMFSGSAGVDLEF
jgi:hypothetical protein